jgi:glutathionylspermidine synthase
MFFTVDGGIQIAEMNSDTPSSLEEAVYLNKTYRELYPTFENRDINEAMEQDFSEMIQTSFHSTFRHNKEINTATAAIVYPTEIPEDMGLIELYADVMKELGMKVYIGSPYNLGYTEEGKVTMFGAEIDVLLRHYKTDWWTERLSAWTDEEEIPDPKPLDKQLRWILKASIEQKLCVVNPMGAIVSQNKHSMAYFWEHIEQFSEKSQQTIRSFIPKTYRFTSMNKEQLLLQKEQWVLKSIYGCEGAEVIIGAFTKPEEWERSINAVEPHQWIVQQFFSIQPQPNGSLPNFGMYLIGGKASGILLRISNANASTDLSSLTVPIFLG